MLIPKDKSAELAEQKHQELPTQSSQKVQSQFRAFAKKLEQQAAKGRRQVTAKLKEYGTQVAAERKAKGLRLRTAFGKALVVRV